MPFDGVVKAYKTPVPELDSNILRVLQEAMRLIDEKGWCRHNFARWNWCPVPLKSRFANRFCARGAILRASHNLGIPLSLADQATHWLSAVIGHRVTSWNDKCAVKEQVVAGFGCAIAEYVDIKKAAGGSFF